ncbi:MAG: NrfD/PsrC family molybdoenzyme membrane anchor subunit [Halobacteriales archaeon]
MAAPGSGLLWLPRGHWEIFIAIYLFLGGVSGGAYLTSVVSTELFRPRAGSDEELFACEETSRWGAILGVVAIAIGGMALLYHLGAPLRALTFPVLFSNFGSWLVIGTWFIVLFATLATLEAFWLLFGTPHTETEGRSYFPRWILAWIDGVMPWDGDRGIVWLLDTVADLLRPSERMHTRIRAAGSIFAVGVVVYTAMLLTDLASVPFWNRTYLPFIFLMSGASTGISAALFGTVLSGGGTTRTNHMFCLVDDGLIVVELAFIGGLLAFLQSGNIAARETYAALTGSWGLSFFVGGVLILGLAVPFLMSMTMTALVKFTEIEESTAGSYAMSAGFAAKYALVLAGGFLLRYVVLFAAVKNPMVVPT